MAAPQLGHALSAAGGAAGSAQSRAGEIGGGGGLAGAGGGDQLGADGAGGAGGGDQLGADGAGGAGGGGQLGADGAGGGTKAVGAAVLSGVPQLPQNASPGITLSPQLGQRPWPAAGPGPDAPKPGEAKPPDAPAPGRAATPASEVPQLSQKAAPAGTCALQLGQLIMLTSSFPYLCACDDLSAAQVAHIQPPGGGDQSFGGVGREGLPGVDLRRGRLRLARQLYLARVQQARRRGP